MSSDLHAASLDLLSTWQAANSDQEALRKEFPDAEITVQSQDGVGSIPRPLNTAVYDDSGEYDALAAEVDDIAARVYEAFDWLVKRDEPAAD